MKAASFWMAAICAFSESRCACCGGVAGLQAIATAKRLGAVIEASDVRPSVKDQVESLGAKWVDVPYANDEEKKIAEGVGVSIPSAGHVTTPRESG